MTQHTAQIESYWFTELVREKRKEMTFPIDKETKVNAGDILLLEEVSIDRGLKPTGKRAVFKITEVLGVFSLVNGDGGLLCEVRMSLVKNED